MLDHRSPAGGRDVMTILGRKPVEKVGHGFLNVFGHAVTSNSLCIAQIGRDYCGKTRVVTDRKQL